MRGSRNVYSTAWLGALIPSGGTTQLTWLSDQPGWYGVGELCFGINLNSATVLVTYNCSGHMAYICQICEWFSFR